MNTKERAILYKVQRALQAVETVKNPADLKRITSFYYGMVEVRAAVVRVMQSLMAPSYADEVDEDLESLAQIMRQQGELERIFRDGRGGWWNEPEKEAR